MSRERHVPRLALGKLEAAESIGVSPDQFRVHVQPHLRWVHLGGRQVVRVAELDRFLASTEGRSVAQEMERVR